MNCFILMPKRIAKERGLKFYFSGSVCARGNVWIRRTSTGNCVCHDCRAIKNRGNKDHYNRIKNDPEFKKRVRQITREKKDWKREYDKAYRERTREKQREWSREWCRKNREKRKAVSHNYAARRRSIESSGVSASDLVEWKERQKKECYWCGTKCRKAFHVDHYVPLALGGLHELDNLVIACPSCNLKKNAKHPYDFAQEVGKLF